MVSLRESTSCFAIWVFPQEYPTLTTFFEGEIISRKHPFLTRKWDADEDVDRKHWVSPAPAPPSSACPALVPPPASAPPSPALLLGSHPPGGGTCGAAWDGWRRGALHGGAPGRPGLALSELIKTTPGYLPEPLHQGHASLVPLKFTHFPASCPCLPCGLVDCGDEEFGFHTKEVGVLTSSQMPFQGEDSGKTYCLLPPPPPSLPPGWHLPVDAAPGSGRPAPMGLLLGALRAGLAARQLLSYSCFLVELGKEHLSKAVSPEFKLDL